MYFISVLLTLAGLLSPQQMRGERLVAELLKRELLANERTVNYERTLSLVTKGTKFENRWQVNQQVKDDYLNVFVLKAGIRNLPDLPEGLGEFFGSCTSLGEKNIVICDDRFVGTFLEVHNVPDMIKAHPDRDNQWRRHNEAFLYWVLGHEIGHIIKGHGAAHFGSGSDKLEKETPDSSIEYDQELVADAFLVNQVSKDKEMSLSLVTMSIDLLNAEIREKVGVTPVGAGILFDYTNKKLVRYMRLRTHPEYVIRLTRVLQKLGELEGNEGLKNMADAFARNLREG